VEPGAILPARAEGWVLVAGLAAVTALLPQLLYTLACPRVGPARSAAAGSLELPTMFAVGWLAFGEAIGPRELMAAILVIGAIAVSPAIRPGDAEAPQSRKPRKVKE
jgi:drug/metabolite transporter (DMT)-like permease